MRLTFTLPLLAALALAACGSDSDTELADGALATDEVMPEISDNGTMPQPGEYATRFELVSFEVPGATSIDMDTLRREFAEGAGEQTSFCVTEAMDREAWISAMTDNICTIQQLNAEGDQLELAMTCDAEDGPQGRIAMAGTQGESSASLEMRWTQPIPGHGEAAVVTRLTSERTGDCS